MILATIRMTGKLLLFALMVGIITMLSDYLWSILFEFPLYRRGAIERVGRYWIFSFIGIVISGTFLLFILNDFLVSKRKKIFPLNVLLLMLIGLIVGIITQGDGWEFYLGPGRRAKHIIIVGLLFAVYPIFSKWFDKVFIKKRMPIT